MVIGVAAGKFGADAETVIVPGEYLDVIINAHFPAYAFTMAGPK